MDTELQSLSVHALLTQFVEVLDELQRRGVTRSTNNQVADYAEFLCEKGLSLTRAPKSTKGYDATDPAGNRYEVKARRVTSHNKSRQLSALRELESVHFTYLAGVLFREDFSVWKACLVPHAAVLKAAKYIEHTNSWKFELRDDVWRVTGVVDVSDKLAQAQRASRT